MRRTLIDTACVLLLVAFGFAAGFVVRSLMELHALPTHGFSGMMMG
jgi:hypothetical protein